MYFFVTPYVESQSLDLELVHVYEYVIYSRRLNHYVRQRVTDGLPVGEETVPADDDEVNLVHLVPRMILRSKFRIEWFIQHQMDKLPDISEVPHIPDESLQWWLLKKKMKKKDR